MQQNGKKTNRKKTGCSFHISATTNVGTLTEVQSICMACLSQFLFEKAQLYLEFSFAVYTSAPHIWNDSFFLSAVASQLAIETVKITWLLQVHFGR